MQPLECEVKVEYWHAERKVTRFSKQLLELSKDGYNNVVLLIPPKSRKPYQYKLTGNLKEVIAPRVAEGKLTLRLNLPDVYVYVENANPEVLGEWVTILMHIKDKPHFDIDDYYEQQRGSDI